MKLFGTKIFESKASAPDVLSQPLAEQVRALAWSAQSVGMTRNHMEDSAFALTMQLLFPEHPVTLGIYMVADGMGGHDNGEVASRLAVQASVKALIEMLILPLDQAQKIPSHQEVFALLEAAFARAQAEVLKNVSGGGTTLTLALLLENDLYFGHIGDSRLYLRSKSTEFQALTQDHSLVRRLVDLGQISDQEAANHPQRNVLFRALGQTDGFKTDLGHYPLTEPTQLLLCTDGLWGLVEEEDLLNTIKAAKADEDIAQALCELANQAGGTDNISVIFVEIK